MGCLICYPKFCNCQSDPAANHKSLLDHIEKIEKRLCKAMGVIDLVIDIYDPGDDEILGGLGPGEVDMILLAREIKVEFLESPI
jgi:hypothetical protein